MVHPKKIMFIRHAEKPDGAAEGVNEAGDNDPESLRPAVGSAGALALSFRRDPRLVLGVLFEEVLAWVRSLPGSQRLRALVAFDEVYGFLPPHPQNSPTERPLVALMKQARAFGVGGVIATQNPMDLDYRALSKAGLCCIGRLQTDADPARVVDALSASAGFDRAATQALTKP
jgi:DNA helicase HerA-like ATPase